MEEPINLLQPNSSGALLAEEWTTDPTTTLPSFLEMMMIQEASRSGRQTLASVIDILLRWLEPWNGVASLAAPSRETVPRAQSIRTLCTAIRNYSRRLVHHAATYVSHYKPEVEFLVWYFLERSALRSSASATLAEALYGMKRSKLTAFIDENGNNVSGRRKIVDLSSIDRTRVALISATIPYLGKKYYRLVRRRLTYSTIQDNSPRMRMLIGAYLPISLALASAKMICQWRFLSGDSLFFELKSLFLNQVVRRVSRAEQNKSLSQSTSATTEWGKSSSVEDGMQRKQEKAEALRSILYLLAASVSFSWLTQVRAALVSHRRRRMQAATTAGSLSSDSIPPPPSRLPTRYRVLTSPAVDCCPICLGRRRNPTASSSGYVFCDECLRLHVRRFATCPVTNAPCTESMMVKLFEPSSNG